MGIKIVPKKDKLQKALEAREKKVSKQRKKIYTNIKPISTINSYW